MKYRYEFTEEKLEDLWSMVKYAFMDFEIRHRDSPNFISSCRQIEKSLRPKNRNRRKVK